jgi:hypothetical protein
VRTALLILAALLAAPAIALADDVVSPAAESVGVTIYRDGPVNTAQLREGQAGDSGLALITETRTVDLPAGRSRIRFEGVADGIVPESAAIEGLPAGGVERNFDYDLLDPASMLARSIGETVTLRRIDAKTGKVTEEPAVVRAAPDGVTLQTARGFEALHCSGGAEGLIFSRMPAGLADRPTLSAIADAPAAGRYKIRLSYLSVRLNWSADYVARIAADGRSLDLLGWITLANASSMSFANAPTSVVAGNLARVAVSLPQPNAPALDLACWPHQTTHSGWLDDRPPPPPPPPEAPVAVGALSDEVIVTAARREERLEKVPIAVTQRELGDYKLYSLIEPTTVAAKETKQVAFLHKAGVTFDTVYVFDAGEAANAAGRPLAAAATLRFENKTAKGLGAPLPQGTVWLRQTPPDGGELFIGSAPMNDVAVDAPFELVAGQASDVQLSGRLVSNTLIGKRRRLSFSFEATNAKAVPVTAEVRAHNGGERGLAFVAESQGHGRKGGDPVWTLPLPANGGAPLTYTIEYDE